ncbi:MAG: NAD-dependent epimerase/dehydratase family protein [Verrucomicrobia bacterium]|nr:NAD-dependent epimerase/dehydratase family protein [Verrucomicrobiota bacterium]
MSFACQHALVTGAAGFIGSHVADRLLAMGVTVVGYDNFSTGQPKFLNHLEGNPRFRLVRGDILDGAALSSAMAGVDFVFHLAANADVRGGQTNPRIDLEQNTIGTHSVLEAMRKAGARRIAFTSSATVYGEPETFPTPEDCPLIQTSTYGASKAAAEHFMEAYCEFYDFQTWVFRFVSFLGERYPHGVVFDFLKKLRANPKEMEILGDGKQRKSYLHVSDALDGFFMAIEKTPGAKNIFNVGNTEYLDVCAVADCVCKCAGYSSVKYRFTGGVRGWKGDSPFVHLDIRRLQALGWQPKLNVREAIRRTVAYLLANSWLLEARK